MRLNEWRTQQRLNYRQIGELLGMKTEPARRLCLPPHDRLRTEPNIEQLVKILEVTGGKVTAADFHYPPEPPPVRKRRRAPQEATA